MPLVVITWKVVILIFHKPSQCRVILTTLVHAYLWFTVTSLVFFVSRSVACFEFHGNFAHHRHGKQSSSFKTYHCKGPHLITSKTALPWQLCVVSSAVDFVSESIIRQIHQQFPASGAAETRCMVTSLFILIKFGHDNHITFRNSLETRLTSLRKIYVTNSELMDRTVYFPEVYYGKIVTLGDWGEISE